VTKTKNECALNALSGANKIRIENFIKNINLASFLIIGLA